MAKFQFEGVDKLVQQYEKLNKNTEKVIGSAIYNGAGVVMKAVKSGVEGIATDNRFGTAENPVSGPTTIQKIGLQHALGIAKMRNDNGFWNVKIGFDGYNNVKTNDGLVGSLMLWSLGRLSQAHLGCKNSRTCGRQKSQLALNLRKS